MHMQYGTVYRIRILARVCDLKRNDQIDDALYRNLVYLSRDHEHVKYKKHELSNRYTIIRNDRTYNNPFKNNLDLRLKWMEGSLNKKNFGMTLLKRDKLRKYIPRMIELYDLTIESMDYICNRVLTDEFSVTNLEDCVQQFYKIYDYHDNYCSYVHDLYYL
jgi:hypothetical protein